MSECVCVRECVRQPIVLSSEPPETTVGSALVHPPGRVVQSSKDYKLQLFTGVQCFFVHVVAV